MSFQTYTQAFALEKEYREGIKFDDLCTYGVRPLDDALLAIAKNELIVIAAGSGFGKTELSLQISRVNAMRGKKVAHYNLEGGYREAIQRMKWRDITEKYYTSHYEMGIDIDYREWVLNRLSHPLFKQLESEVLCELENKLTNLYLFDGPHGLNCSKFCESLKIFQDLRSAMEMDFLDASYFEKSGDKPDLVVVDHLHYFSLDKDEDEIAEITSILHQAKDITEKHDVPVILVAHLRKLPRGHGIPDKEDVYGTSNIHKIANTVIIIAPDHEKDDVANGIYPTYFRIAKSRQGLRPNLLMQCNFDSRKRVYGEKYDIFKCFPDGSVSSEPLSGSEIPRWAMAQYRLQKARI